MKRKLILVVFITLLTLPAFAFDWGGFLDNATTLNIDSELDIDQANKLGFWISAPFTDQLSLDAQVSYQFTLERPFFVDIDFLKLNGQFIFEESGPFSLNFTMGRLLSKEFTTYVLRHNLDGLKISMGFPFLTASLTAGFTGLTFVPNSQVILTKSDLTARGNAPDHGFALAPPKLIEVLEIGFPGLFLRQDLLFSFLFQQDLQSDANLSSGGRIHTEYFGLGLSGPIVQSFYYDTFFYLNLGQADSYSTLAFLAGGSLRLYLRKALFSRLELKGLFSSGDANQSSFYEGFTGSGSSMHFVGLSRPSFGIVFSPHIGNMVVGELNYSLKPFSGSGIRAMEDFQTMLKALTFLRPTTGAISESGIDTASTQLYLGTEVDLILNFRPLSDLGFSLSGGLFIPNSFTSGSAFTESAQPLQGAARFELSFSF